MTKKILALTAVVALLLSACLKDKDIEDRKHGSAGVEDFKLIGMTNAPESVTGMFASNEDTVVGLVTLRLHAGISAPEDINIQLVKNDELVIDAGLELLPEDRYSIASYAVTIPKGAREVTLTMRIAPNDILDGHYGIGLSIDTVYTKGYEIRRWFSEVMVELAVLNDYDGVYRATGVIGGHLTAGGPFDREIELETFGEKSVVFYQPNANGLFTGVLVMATVNDDNTVTIEPLPGFPAVYVPAGGVNTYDPATRTFNLRFNWPGSPTREATNTFRFIRRR